MNQHLTDTITVLEMTWTILGIIGVCVNVWGINQAVRDQIRAYDTSDKALRIVARAEVIREGTRMLMHSIVIAIGVVAMTQTNPPEGQPTSTLAYLIVWGLVTQPILLIFQSAHDAYVRRVVKTMNGTKEG